MSRAARGGPGRAVVVRARHGAQRRRHAPVIDMDLRLHVHDPRMRVSPSGESASSDMFLRSATPTLPERSPLCHQRMKRDD